MSDKILIVDDEPEIADLIELYLKNEDFAVYKFYTAKEALDCAQNTDIDLAILDIMLPDISGYTLCRKMRECSSCPIIMLTAKDGEADKITGLTLGADDYVTKPFRPLELVARVKAQLRRYKKYNSPRKENDSDNILSYLDIELNTKTHECTQGGRLLALTPTEFLILEILLRQKGNVVSSEDLFREIWKDEYYTKNNTVTVHVRHLREKLNDSAENPKYIKTVWGVGYKIEKQK